MAGGGGIIRALTDATYLFLFSPYNFFPTPSFSFSFSVSTFSAARAPGSLLLPTAGRQSASSAFFLGYLSPFVASRLEGRAAKRCAGVKRMLERIVVNERREARKGKTRKKQTADLQ